MVGVRGCLPDDLPAGQFCANEYEASEYFSRVNVMILYFKNFINYEKFQDDPVERTI